MEEDEDLWILEYWAPSPKSILAVYVKTGILKNHSTSLIVVLYQYANVNCSLEHCLKYNKESHNKLNLRIKYLKYLMSYDP